MVCCMSRPRDNYSRFNRPPAEQSPASGGTLSFSIGMARRSRKKSSNTSALRASASDVDLRQVLAGVLLIAGAVLVIYWPSLRGDFVLDDEILVSQNNLVRASDGLTRFWFSNEPADYWPMTNSSFGWSGDCGWTIRRAIAPQTLLCTLPTRSWFGWCCDDWRYQVNSLRRCYSPSIR